MKIAFLALALAIGPHAHLFQGRAAGDVVGEFLSHPDEPSKRIEIFWARPAGEGVFPILIYIHGHQEGPRPGAAVYATGDILKREAARGWVAVAVSQPGYGKSDGPPDFCGPRSQRAVIAVIDHFRRQPFVDARRIGLYGYSRGAVVAAMVATRVQDLAALVLGGGIYDLKETLPRLAPGIQQNIEMEAGKSDEAFRARSAMQLAEQIRTPTLILHGEIDDRASAESARRFGARLEKAGTAVKVVIFPATGHGIPPAERAPHVDPFLARYLLASSPR